MRKRQTEAETEADATPRSKVPLAVGTLLMGPELSDN